MIRLSYVFLMIVFLLGTFFTACQQHNYKAKETSSNSIESTLLRLQDISPDAGKNNLFPFAKTDLTNQLIDNVHQANDYHLLIESSEDKERNRYLMLFDFSTGKILDKSKSIYNLGSYQGDTPLHWIFTQARTGSLLLFSRSNLDDVSTGSTFVQKLFIADDHYVALNGIHSIDTMTYHLFDGEVVWKVPLEQLSIMKHGVSTFFLPLIFKQNSHILLFSYDDEVLISSAHQVTTETTLFYWIFDQKDGKLLYTDFFAHNTHIAQNDEPFHWRSDGLFHQKDNSLLFFNRYQEKLVVECYLWEGKQSLTRTWVLEFPQELWSEQDKIKSYLHSKIFSDTSHYWMIVQQSSPLSYDKGFRQSFLVSIEKSSGFMQSKLLLSEDAIVKDWTLREGQFLFSFENSVKSLKKSSKEILWHYEWEQQKNHHTQVLFENYTTFLLSYFQPENHRILLQAIDKTGTLIPISTFTDTTEMQEMIQSSEPGVYIPLYDLFIIPIERDHFLVISNRGEVFRFGLHE